jgi:hypothetical protein
MFPFEDRERTKIDLDPARDTLASCLVFIRGGYWQRNSRDVFAMLVEGMAAMVRRHPRLFACARSDIDRNRPGDIARRQRSLTRHRRRRGFERWSAGVISGLNFT